MVVVVFFFCRRRRCFCTRESLFVDDDTIIDDDSIGASRRVHKTIKAEEEEAHWHEDDVERDTKEETQKHSSSS